MTLPGLLERRRNPIVNNLAARIGALVALTVASLVVAREGGAAEVGAFVLLRVLPWALGVVLSFGAFGAAPYFLSGPNREETGYRPTIFWVCILAGIMGAGIWVVAAPAIHAAFFPNLGTALVALAGATVLTQLTESVGKACCQGFDDLRGSNWVILFEELLFLPAYGLYLLAGLDRELAMVMALVTGDVGTSLTAWIRVSRRGYFKNTARPSLRLARRVCGFGFRAQIGTVVLLLNARLDFAVVGALVGPAALGIYAIASRYAELLRLPALAVNYVLYPAYSREGPVEAARRAREMMPKAGWLTAAAALPLAVGATFLLPLLYGEQFKTAIVPTYILLAGLAGGGVSGIITAYLYADNRPGQNSAALGAGLVVTVALDLLLIPRFGVLGASVASCCAYWTATLVLVLLFRSVAHSRQQADVIPVRARTAVEVK
ncbi:MAG: oligosaccharide flippase family protein [Actinomycetota bacterium]